jgi:hypothetical protein
MVVVVVVHFPKAQGLSHSLSLSLCVRLEILIGGHLNSIRSLLRGIFINLCQCNLRVGLDFNFKQNTNLKLLKFKVQGAFLKVGD